MWHREPHPPESPHHSHLDIMRTQMFIRVHLKNRKLRLKKQLVFYLNRSSKNTTQNVFLKFKYTFQLNGCLRLRTICKSQLTTQKVNFLPQTKGEQSFPLRPTGGAPNLRIQHLWTPPVHSAATYLLYDKSAHSDAERYQNFRNWSTGP